MKVWINQELCTGDAQCADVCPDVFFMHEADGAYRAYVRDVGDDGCDLNGAPKLRMHRGQVVVPPPVEAAVVEAAEDCPGECIVVVLDD